MQQLILIKDLDQSKMDALLYFLKTWNIEAELKTSAVFSKKKAQFSLSSGLWKEYDIDADELRNNAWSRSK